MKKNIVLKKFLWTILFVLIYLVGTHITFLNIEESPFKDLESNYLLKLASSVTGGSLDNLNIFSIGIWPWMTTLILWRVITMIKRFNLDKMVKRKTDRIQMIMSLFLAIIQGIVVTNSFDLDKSIINFSSKLEAQVFLILILTTGSFILIWIGNMNSLFGIGGPTIIILIGMIVNWPREIVTFLLLGYYKEDYLYAGIVAAIIALSFAIVYITTLLETAEYRIKVNRIMINNNLSNKAYLPIKLNPAGVMPIMYSLSLLAVPQYAVLGLRYLFPANDIIKYLAENLSINSNLGITVYISLLFLLSLGFALVNVNPEDLAENFKKSGDYISGVKPGIDTKNYLNSTVLKFAFVGGTAMCVLTGFPYYVVNIKTGITGLLMFPGTAMMFTTFVLNMIEEVRVLRIKSRYKNLFD